MHESDGKYPTASTPAKRITESTSSAETDQLGGEDSRAIAGEVEEDPEAPRTTEAVEAAEEEESAMEDEDIPSYMPSAFSSAPSSPPASVGFVSTGSVV